VLSPLLSFSDGLLGGEVEKTIFRLRGSPFDLSPEQTASPFASLRCPDSFSFFLCPWEPLCCFAEVADAYYVFLGVLLYTSSTSRVLPDASVFIVFA